MKKKNSLNFYFLGLLWITCLCLTQKAVASHTYGAEIAYKCLGNSQYQIQLTLVRDCNGIALSNLSFIDVSSVSCGLNIGSVQLALDTIYEISQNCPSVVSACTGGNIPSVENYIYTGIVTFPEACTDWVLSWSNCCRTASITNLATSQAPLYLEAGINNTVCNSSPLFTSRPFVYFCTGNCHEYSYGGYDPDRDTVRYALTCPLQGANTCIPNTVGLQPTQPLLTNPANSFSFNENTGQMSFCPDTVYSQHIVLAVTAYQISNGDTIGYTQKDIQAVILNGSYCGAVPKSTDPIVTGGGTYNNANQLFEVCSGDVLTFETTVHQPEGIPIQLDLLNTNLDKVMGVGNWSVTFDTLAPYRSDSARAFIQIITTKEHIGMNHFTLSFRDNSCPFQGLNTKTYQLSVIGIKASIGEEGTSSAIYCPGIATSIPLKTNVNSSVLGSYSWTQTIGPTVTFSSMTDPNPMLFLPNTTQDGDSIVISVTYTTGTCTSTDEILIKTQISPINLEVLASDTTLCPNGMVDTIAFSILAGNSTVNTSNGLYTWSATPTSFLSNLMNTTTNTPFAILNTVANDTITYKIRYDYGLCADSVETTLTTRSGEVVASTNLDTICAGDTVQLMAILTDTIYAFSPITYDWTPSTAVSDATIYNPTGNPQQTTTYVVSVNEGGCIQMDSVEIVVNTTINAPMLSCGFANVPTNSILFEWGQALGATAWEYSLDSGATWTASLLNDSSFLYTGLQQGTCYGIWVRALGSIGTCSNNAATYLDCCTNVLSNAVTQNGMTLSAVEVGPSITYQWVDCNNGNAPITGATGQSFTPTVNGNYAVRVEDGVNTVLSTCYNINVTEVTTLVEQLGILCYPNPTTGLLQIERENTELLDIQVVDYLGRVLLVEQTTETQLNIDLTAYPAGIYILEFKTATKRLSQKVVKE